MLIFSADFSGLLAFQRRMKSGRGSKVVSYATLMTFQWSITKVSLLKEIRTLQ
jgi:hypothetical protein